MKIQLPQFILCLTVFHVAGKEDVSCSKGCFFFKINHKHWNHLYISYWIFLQVERIRTGHRSPVSKDYVGRVLKSMKLLILGVVKCLWKQQVLVDIALLLALLDSDLDLRSSGRKGPWKMLHLIGPTYFRHIDVWGWKLKWIIQINDLQFVLDLFSQIEIVWHVCYRFLGSS